MKKNLIANRKDEEAYRRHLFVFNNVFLAFIYHSLDRTIQFSARGGGS